MKFSLTTHGLPPSGPATPMLKHVFKALTPAVALLTDEAAAVSFGPACPNLSGFFFWFALGSLIAILVAFFGLIRLVCALPKPTRATLCSPSIVGLCCLVVTTTLLSSLC